MKRVWQAYGCGMREGRRHACVHMDNSTACTASKEEFELKNKFEVAISTDVEDHYIFSLWHPHPQYS
jgi:hypothetical protein